MSLARKKIRAEIVGLLKNRTVAKDRVRFGRGEANQEENIPLLNLYWRGETVEEYSQSPRRMKRTAILEVEMIHTGSDGKCLLDNLDDFCEQVERALSVDDTLNCSADDIFLLSVSDIETEADGTRVYGSIREQYNVEYYEYFPRDRKGQGSFDDFSVHAEWNLEGEQAILDQSSQDIDMNA